MRWSSNRRLQPYMSSFIYLGTSFEVHVICFMSRTHHLFKTGFKNMGSIKRSKTVVGSMTESYPSLTKRVRQLPALQTTRAHTHARRTQIYVIILPWINIILNPKYTPWCERTPWRCSEKKFNGFGRVWLWKEICADALCDDPDPSKLSRWTQHIYHIYWDETHDTIRQVDRLDRHDTIRQPWAGLTVIDTLIWILQMFCAVALILTGSDTL